MKKTFNCVEMKDAAQARLREEYEGLTPEQVRKKRDQKLTTSDNPVAQKCRRLVLEREPQKKDAVSTGH